MDMKFITIPEKTVEFEDGRCILVNSFEVSSRCVTIEQFKIFQQESGYVTLGEKCHQKDPLFQHVYFDNDLINELPETDDKFCLSASCMSYTDALAYCEFYNFRLITEEEWLAASIVIDGEYDTRSYDSQHWPEIWDRRILFDKLPYDIRIDGGELTCTTIGDYIIVRDEPTYFKENDWKERVDENRQLIKKNHVDLMNCFRVCKVG